MSLTATNFTTPYTQTFDTLASSFGTTSNVLPTGWYFAESGASANTTYRVDDGQSSTNDTYSFGPGVGATGDRAFGSIRGGTVVPTIGSQFTNNTGATITGLAIQYRGEQWKRGASGRQDRLDFQISTNATSLTAGTYTDVDALDYVAASGAAGSLDGNVNSATVSATVTGLSIPDGGTFWVRWNDFDAANSDDGLAVDDFTLTAVAPVPEPSSVLAVAAAGLGLAGWVRRRWTHPVGVTRRSPG